MKKSNKKGKENKKQGAKTLKEVETLRDMKRKTKEKDGKSQSKVKVNGASWRWKHGKENTIK